MKTKQKAIIVDLDGTLVDSRHRALSSPEEYREKSFDEEYCREILDDAMIDSVAFSIFNLDNMDIKYKIFLSERLDTVFVRKFTGRFIRENLSSEKTTYIQCLKPLDSCLTDAEWKAKKFAEFASYLDIVEVYDDKKEILEAMMDCQTQDGETYCFNSDEMDEEQKKIAIAVNGILEDDGCYCFPPEKVREKFAPNCKFYLVEEDNITNLE